MPRYILGMSKTPKDIRGAKQVNLRLDLLELIIAVRFLRDQGHEAQGYICVIYDQSKKLLDRWNKKYNGNDFVKVVQPDLTNLELAELNAEKETLSKSKGGKTSVAKKSEIIGEMNLIHLIEKKFEPNVTRCSESNPLEVRWDYFGTIV